MGFGRHFPNEKHMTTNPSLAVMDPLASFVDVGSEQMHVSMTNQLDRCEGWNQGSANRQFALDIVQALRRQGRNHLARDTDYSLCN